MSHCDLCSAQATVTDDNGTWCDEHFLELREQIDNTIGGQFSTIGADLDAIGRQIHRCNRPHLGSCTLETVQSLDDMRHNRLTIRCTTPIDNGIERRT